MQHVLLTLTLFLASLQIAAAGSLRLLDREALEDLGSKSVFASVHHVPGDERQLPGALVERRHINIEEISTVIVQIPADVLLNVASDPAIREIELIDDDIARRIVAILNAIRSINLEHGTLYRFGALNISLGPPKVKLDKNRSAERTVRRALEHLIQRHGIPVVLSLGNDGPTPGLVNPWALAKGVIGAAAADSKGHMLWHGSSRFLPDGAKGHDIFAGYGYLSVGAKAAGSTKTQNMIEAESKVNLTEIVGAGNEALYRVDSGTSYAAAEITRSVCQIHQAVHLLQLLFSATTPLEVRLPQFVRAYIDTGVDTTHPVFAQRLADRTPIYAGPLVKFERERKQALHRLVLGGGKLDLSYGPRVVLALLKRAAAPVPNTTADETGHGFVSRDLVLGAIAALTYTDLVALFGTETDSRHKQVQQLAASIPGTIFLPDEISLFGKYCDDYDLVMMYPVR